MLRSQVKDAVFSGKTRKIIHYSCEGGIEKSVPRDHHLSSLGKPRDAYRGSSGQIFYPTLTLMMDSYYNYPQNFLYKPAHTCLQFRLLSISAPSLYLPP